MRAKYNLLVLVVIFIIPLFLATFFYHHPNILNSNSTNLGVLLKPPITMDALKIDNPHKWTLILFSSEADDVICNRKLYYLHQIHKATGKDQERISEMLLTYVTKDKIDKSILMLYPDMQIQTANKNNLLKENTIFIADPNGNIILAYSSQSKPMDVFMDLKKLLRFSQIG